MVVCSQCQQDLPKAEFSGAQLKKNAKRACSACVAAAAMAEAVLSNPPTVQSEEAPEYGYQVGDRPGVGRILITTRDFAAGELVLRETPALTFHPDRADELLAGFLGASPEVQAAVLEMPTPSLEADLDMASSPKERESVLAARKKRVASRTALATQLASEYEGSPRILELVEALLLIADSQSYAFEDRVGFFPMAALASHSCNPSCGHGTRVAGEMRFWASRPLAAGEQITISFLPALFSTPRDVRRRTLMLEKLFFCRCSRCTDLDHCRGMSCAVAKCDGVAARADAGVWRCGSCKVEHTEAAMKPSIESESALAKQARALRPTQKGAPPSTADVLKAVQAVRDSLSPSHHLAPELLAQLLELNPPPPPRERAAVAAQALATLECAAAGCHSLKCARHGVTQHPPCAVLVGEAVTAAITCANGGTKDLVGLAGVISSRYLPWAARQFGPQDASVKTMQKVLDLVAPNAVKSGIVEEEVKEVQ
jgi:hypothetical protein